ncbi:hypothetical protein SDC9_157638 [bioreactor metagenome]|uniref:Uncharacterized protein n=1 Tax=bioreactor metagenome TaxID=1076179 RepID=A0A645FD86_9ZZZZ
MYQLGGFARGFSRLPGQASDFFGNNRKPFSVITGSGGFHCGIQRQNVCLESDVLDDFDDFADVVGRRVDRLHGPKHLCHLRVACLRVGADFLDKQIGRVGALCVFIGLCCNLLQ